ncbi:hypothetical protein NE237_025459 [Protea cynaroides]|uniref:SAM domain-containing protein n=1 Tax=Protea cynaroides TaxID=273540 RepID=A0A9Q0H2F1_9MAGN|nr:hypothetical protein NE237_025459 [Protea cynaroides]
MSRDRISTLVPRSDPIQCIGRSADELSKRDLLVAVESVIGKTEKLVALDLESKGLCVLPSTKAVDAALFYKNDFRAEDGYQFDFVLISVMRNLGWTVEAKAIYEEMKGKRLFISRQLFLLVCDELLGIINWSDHLPGVVPSSPSRKPLVNFCISNGSLFWLLHSNHGSDRTPVDGTTRLKIAARAVRLHPIFHFSQLKQYRGDPAQVDTRVPIWLYPVDIAPDFEIIKLIRFEAEVSRIYPYRYFPKTPKSIILPLRDLGFIFFPKIKVYHSLSVREINMIKPSFIDDLDNELCRNFFDHIDDLLDFPMEDVGSGDSGGECNGFQGACWPPIVDALTGSTNTVLYGKNGDNTTSEFSTELSVPIQAALPQATPTRSSWQMYNRSVSGLAVCFSPLVDLWNLWPLRCNRENRNSNSSKLSFELAVSGEANAGKPALNFGIVIRKGRLMKRKGQSTIVSSNVTNRTRNAEVIYEINNVCYKLDEFWTTEVFVKSDTMHSDECPGVKPQSGFECGEMGFGDSVINIVRTWLEQPRFAKCLGLIEMHEVDEEALPLLTIEDLKEMGINNVGPLRNLYTEIQHLSEGGGVSAWSPDTRKALKSRWFQLTQLLWKTQN